MKLPVPEKRPRVPDTGLNDPFIRACLVVMLLGMLLLVISHIIRTPPLERPRIQSETLLFFPDSVFVRAAPDGTVVI